jgi:hypothetical protein
MPDDQARMHEALACVPLHSKPLKLREPLLPGSQRQSHPKSPDATRRGRWPAHTDQTVQMKAEHHPALPLPKTGRVSGHVERR